MATHQLRATKMSWCDGTDLRHWRETWAKRQSRQRGRDIAEGKRAAQTLSLPLCLPSSLPFHNRGPAPALLNVCSRQACFLLFSTIEPFSARCFCNDRGILPLSCADRPAKSCCGLLVQRGHINTGSMLTN